MTRGYVDGEGMVLVSQCQVRDIYRKCEFAAPSIRAILLTDSRLIFTVTKHKRVRTVATGCL